MTAPVRTIPVRRLAAAFAALGGVVLVSGPPARAQVAPAPAPNAAASETATPVELAINVVNGRVVCLPQTMRLPARDLIGLRVINKSTRPIMFAAPDFFRASQGMRTDGVRYNPERGGFLVEAGGTLPVALRTPPAGEYYYACSELGEVSTVLSTGFLVVVPGPGTPGVQAPPRR